MDKIKLKPSAIAQMVIGGGIIFYGLTHSIFKVEPGYNAIKFNKITGVRSQVFKEGFHLMVPYFEYPIVYDCKLGSKTYDVHCGTKGINLIINRFTNYKLENKSYHKTVHWPITSIIQIIRTKLLRQGTSFYCLWNRWWSSCNIHYNIIFKSQYNASQLITQRDTVSMIIKNRVQEKGREFHIDMSDVALVISWNFKY